MVQQMTERAVDNSEWDAGRAMREATTAAEYSKICAGKKAGDPALRSSHALPHHYLSKHPAPNAGGTRAALAALGGARGGVQGLTNEAQARSHLESHMKEINPDYQPASAASFMPTKDNLVRAVFDGGLLLREAEESNGQNGGMPTMYGYFARFNQWTEVASLVEGHFMEQIAPGAFVKTFRERKGSIKPLFQHGRDPNIGMKVLGPAEVLREDDQGAYYEVPLLDTTYNRDLLPGLREGLYGASFKFRITREELVEEPGRSKHNPGGLPERTIKETQVYDIGPVTFPQYEGATAGVRSLTDLFVFDQLVGGEPDKLRELIEAYTRAQGDAATTSDIDAGDTHLDEPDGIRAGDLSHPDEQGTSPDDERERIEVRSSAHSGEERDSVEPTIQELEARREEVKERLASLFAENGASGKQEVRDEWDAHDAELKELDERIGTYQTMQTRLAEIAGKAPTSQESGFTAAPFSAIRTNDPFDLSTVRYSADPDEVSGQLRDRAMKAVEIAKYPASGTRESFQDRVSWLLDNVDDDKASLARRVLLTGNPAYEKSFWKHVGNRSLTTQEQAVLDRAMTVATEGAIAVPFTLDPSVILTSAGSVNPLRQISRVESITTETWKGVTSAGISAQYRGAEAVEADDDSPTLAQPEVSALRADAFIPFSYELGQDWGQLRTEMNRMLSESKDDLESLKFIAGTGTVEPSGLLTGATATVATAGTGAFAEADLYRLEEALPPRARQRSSFVSTKFAYNKVRQFPTNASAALWVRLGEGNPPQLIGYNAYEASAMTGALTATTKLMVLGDFSRFLIVDRIGMDIELVPHLFGAARHYPTGQRGLFAFWRNNCLVLDPLAFRVLVVG